MEGPPLDRKQESWRFKATPGRSFLVISQRCCPTLLPTMGGSRFAALALQVMNLYLFAARRGRVLPLECGRTNQAGPMTPVFLLLATSQVVVAVKVFCCMNTAPCPPN
jgi:hypothetical protein